MHDWEFFREMAKTGVIADGIASGTRSGRDPLELYVVFEELGLADAPFYGLASTMLVAGVLEELGNDFHRTEILPRLHAGEAICVLGYSEPDAGVRRGGRRHPGPPVRRRLGRLDHQRAEDVHHAGAPGRLM